MVQSDPQLAFIYQVLREKWLEKKSANATSINGNSEQNSEPQVLEVADMVADEVANKIADEVVDEVTDEMTHEVEPRPPGAFPED